ncbi:hypothetical protein MVES1_003040 [Malassezia vespertilionis]|uniref:Ubiquitin-like domain-containing protein n=1 Tax=Malassezia vespertilionis TaxID=2020962 RepID=A0A2N1J993_9BASI|nr:uncharacterized protein MVES1_003040 [Malassezia vespertilionis]PKI83131.1 hypothetical protein MVES_002882 [Malassezia vespertilionis]WFD07671.1 hypothetical protein MVES1_003040 [Malassezia vespertilionis]
MAGRPRPRPRAKRHAGAADSCSLHSVDEDAFFFAAARKPLHAAQEEAEPHTAPLYSPRKKPRAALPEWTAAPPTPPTPERVAFDRERSVSVTPPPDLDAASLAFARNAVEKVMQRHASRRVAAPSSDADEGAPQSDLSLELNADLALYYKGPDAHKMRSRALSKERARQAERQQEPIALDEDDQRQVITIDDSSDEEQVMPDRPLPQAVRAPTPEDDDKLALTLRASQGEPLRVVVRPRTQIKTIAAHFALHCTSIGHSSTVYLSFEGERLDANKTVQDYELEEEDQLEVLL